MRFSGSIDIAAPRAVVAADLADPAFVARCSPVPLPVEDLGDERYRAEGRVGNGWFSTTARIDLVRTIDDPASAVSFALHGGASGTTADGALRFALAPGAQAGPVTVDWELELALTGGFAGQVTRLVEQRGAGVLEQFLVCLRARIEGGAG